MRWIAATLLAILGLAWALIAFSAPSAKVRPAPDERGIGGLSLFAAALRDAGYRVAFDRSTRPHLAKGDVALVPVVVGGLHAFETPGAVIDFVKRGGRAFVIGVPEGLQAVGPTAQVTDAGGKMATVDLTASATLPRPEAQIVQAAVWKDEEDEVATLAQVGKGRIARLEDGALATNRFLGRRDNARVVLSTLSSLALPGDRLVFLAGGYGEDEATGPIEAIGPWAVGAVWQSLAVLAAFGLARGVRFGLPAAEARSRGGSRELLDTVAGHYRRGRRTDAPLGAAARERPDDAEAQALAARSKVSEADARHALMLFESRPRPRR